MSIELRQAAEQVLEAFDTFGEADDFASLFALTQKMNALRTALSQQPASEEHLFEFWWEAHMPNANQENAWSAFTAAIASNRVGIAAQQPATPEPVYWEWRHLSTHPDTVDFGKWSEWKRVEARSAIHTIDDALAEFRAYIAQGYKYELRALYDHPEPSAPDDVRHIVGWWLCNEANPQDGSPWTIEPSQRVLDHMQVAYGEKHTVMRLVAIDAAMLAAKDASA